MPVADAVALGADAAEFLLDVPDDAVGPVADRTAEALPDASVLTAALSVVAGPRRWRP